MSSAKMSNREKGEQKEKLIKHYFHPVKENGCLGFKSKYVTQAELSKRLGYEIDLTKKK